MSSLGAARGLHPVQVRHHDGFARGGRERTRMAEVVHVETRFDRVGEAHGVHRVVDGALGHAQRLWVGLGDPLREPQSEFAKLLQRHHMVDHPGPQRLLGAHRIDARRSSTTSPRTA
jgi:hypothetical protein